MPVTYQKVLKQELKIKNKNTKYSSENYSWKKKTWIGLKAF